MAIGEKRADRDSKTGNMICLKIMQKTAFARFLSAIEAGF
jgi:hypothetical protein